MLKFYEIKKIFKFKYRYIYKRLLLTKLALIFIKNIYTNYIIKNIYNAYIKIILDFYNNILMKLYIKLNKIYIYIFFIKHF